MFLISWIENNLPRNDDDDNDDEGHGKPAVDQRRHLRDNSDYDYPLEPPKKKKLHLRSDGNSLPDDMEEFTPGTGVGDHDSSSSGGPESYYGEDVTPADNNKNNNINAQDLPLLLLQDDPMTIKNKTETNPIPCDGWELRQVRSVNNDSAESFLAVLAWHNDDVDTFHQRYPTVPVALAAQAPNASWVVAAETGHVGLGTWNPQASLHLVAAAADSPTIRLEQAEAAVPLPQAPREPLPPPPSPPPLAPQDGSSSTATPNRLANHNNDYDDTSSASSSSSAREQLPPPPSGPRDSSATPNHLDKEEEEEDASSDSTASERLQRQAWDIVGNRQGFFLYEEQQPQRRFGGGEPEARRTLPFQVASGAPSFALTVTDQGHVGLGTPVPQAHLHVVGDMRIDGEFTVTGSRNNNGGVCVLDTTKCQWTPQNRVRRRRQRRRRQLRPARSLEKDKEIKNDDAEDEEYHDLLLLQQQQEQAQIIQDFLQEQTKRSQAMIAALEATVQSLQEQQAWLLDQMAALQADMVQVRQGQGQQQQQQQQQPSNSQDVSNHDMVVVQ
ncbi:hypothetical protein ACA910_017307 [Epithemia clementina (nom. ined.)]